MVKPEIVRMSELPEKKEERTKVIVMDRKMKRKVRHGEEEDIEAIAREEGILELDMDAPPEDSPEIPAAPGAIISGSILAAAIASDFGPTCTGGGIYLSDNKYRLYSDHEIKTVLTADLTDLEVWIAQFFDCDDFAQVVAGVLNHQLKGVPFGILWYKGNQTYHAVNCYYSSKGNMRVVEPQTDHVYTFDKTKYSPVLIVI
ncbi:MAG: hypothetical protein HXS48_26925 [Theionarchaea archaeon]|nr:hypothetical protein [Theionarchaea archaeon]